MKMIWLASLYKLRNQKIREDIWLSPKTKALYQQKVNWAKSEHKKRHQKSITKRLRTDLGLSVGVTAATQLVWLTGLRAQPSHSP